MKIEVLIFEKHGKGNTQAVLELSRQRAQELGITQAVVATTHGYTGLEASRVFAGSGIGIIGVSISAAYDDEGWTMSPGERLLLEKAGVTVLTSMHSLGDDVSQAFGVKAPNMIVRETLYTFCQGMKVAAECALMAADAGLLDMGKEVISIAGNSKGADTSIVIKPAYTKNFRKMRIREILAKPR